MILYYTFQWFAVFRFEPLNLFIITSMNSAIQVDEKTCSIRSLPFLRISSFGLPPPKIFFDFTFLETGLLFSSFEVT